MNLKVYLPNESTPTTIDVDLKNFNKDRTYSDRIFGMYDGTFISIDVKDLVEHIDNDQELGSTIRKLTR